MTACILIHSTAVSWHHTSDVTDVMIRNKLFRPLIWIMTAMWNGVDSSCI